MTYGPLRRVNAEVDGDPRICWVRTQKGAEWGIRPAGLQRVAMCTADEEYIRSLELQIAGLKKEILRLEERITAITWEAKFHAERANTLQREVDWRGERLRELGDNDRRPEVGNAAIQDQENK